VAQGQGVSTPDTPLADAQSIVFRSVLASNARGARLHPVDPRRDERRVRETLRGARGADARARSFGRDDLEQMAFEAFFEG
jgi:hypothetical protein